MVKITKLLIHLFPYEMYQSFRILRKVHRVTSLTVRHKLEVVSRKTKVS